jgi:hypothetical protein
MDAWHGRLSFSLSHAFLSSSTSSPLLLVPPFSLQVHSAMHEWRADSVAKAASGGMVA